MKRFFAIVLALGLVATLIASVVLFHGSPATAHASHVSTQSAVEHIKWSPAVVDNAPSFTVTLSGSHFPVDDSEPIDVTTDSTFGPAAACASVVFLQTPVVDSLGNFAVRVEFSGCFGNNNIVASAIDDHHLNHAVLHVN